MKRITQGIKQVLRTIGHGLSHQGLAEFLPLHKKRRVLGASAHDKR